MKPENLEEPLGDFKLDKMSRILSSFGVRHSNISMDEGRYFDRYALTLEAGIKHSKVSSIMSEIGLLLKSKSCPSGVVNMQNGTYDISIQKSGISNPNMVDMIKSLSKEDGLINLALGLDSCGNSIYFDLNSIPNLLIGGTTGSGKSVLMHNLILSCIFSSNPEVVLVDPKRVEFSAYQGLVSKIIKDYDDLEEYLKVLEGKMNARYCVLENFKLRDISSFNRKFKTIKMKPISIFIDEWADIFMSRPHIQESLCKIAQKGRAAGISFVLATQRPSADIISGVIKANFPGRIALRVASGHDSRVIMDSMGAENIEEKGMGYFISGSGSRILFKTGYIKNLEEVLECLRCRKQ